MPSRKKTKGKARKAQAAAAAGVPQQRSLCTHCFAAPDSNDPLWECYDAFEKELSRLEEDPRYKHNPGAGGMMAINAVAERDCTHLWSASLQEKLSAKLIANGVDALLDSVASKANFSRERKTIALMSALLVLENCHGSRRLDFVAMGPSFQGVLEKNKDAFEGCRRSVVRFFAKRAQCSCLDSYYATIKQTLPKMGRCGHCDKLQDRSKRPFMVCGACKKAQYW